MARIFNYKWDLKRAVETPLKPNPTSIWEQKFEWKGKEYTIEELARLSNGKLFKLTIHDLLKQGKSIDEIMNMISPALDS